MVLYYTATKTTGKSGDVAKKAKKKLPGKFLLIN